MKPTSNQGPMTLSSSLASVCRTISNMSLPSQPRLFTISNRGNNRNPMACICTLDFPQLVYRIYNFVTSRVPPELAPACKIISTMCIVATCIYTNVAYLPHMCGCQPNKRHPEKVGIHSSLLSLVSLSPP